MATTFKTLTNNDIASTRTLLHEAIPITGTIVSGTYGSGSSALGSEPNIKNYAHEMFQSVYDYPYLSSSANHIFDITCGFSPRSPLSSSSGSANSDGDGTVGAAVQQAKKINIYNQMAQLLVGYDATGSIREFDTDGDLSGGSKMQEVFFINFARLLNKDEIKKQSFSLTLMCSGTRATAAQTGKFTFQDTNALTTYKVNSPAGEYGLLYNTSAPSPGAPYGLVYYQAGIVVLTSSIFGSAAELTTASPDFGPYDKTWGNGGAQTTNVVMELTGAAISGSCDGLRNRIVNISFNNTTELNSTIYFCRANNNEFNYSANPTYLTASKLRVKNNSTDTPVSYITTVGLYSADNELLATAKLSEPLKKTPDDEFTLRVRLDY
jgi:hypothetical protein